MKRNRYAPKLRAARRAMIRGDKIRERDKNFRKGERIETHRRREREHLVHQVNRTLRKQMYLYSQSRQLITAFTADVTCQSAYRFATLYISPVRGT